ncbi:hypothetical protein P5673_002970 [Acropora cervicornis]|uniref:Uncharacterized protein n=1 Tax=Acropora cervicornis TaxID=6130 RepID=A0AAD9VEH3_ACRCE|nr:hypothetical protein P5673_002970 [Acropora cervicornis]
MCYREEFTPERYISPLPFFSLSDCAETSQAHFPTLRKGKMEKDAHARADIKEMQDLTYQKCLLGDFLALWTRHPRVHKFLMLIPIKSVLMKRKTDPVHLKFSRVVGHNKTVIQAATEMDVVAISSSRKRYKIMLSFHSKTSTQEWHAVLTISLLFTAIIIRGCSGADRVVPFHRENFED